METSPQDSMIIWPAMHGGFIVRHVPHGPTLYTLDSPLLFAGSLHDCLAFMRASYAPAAMVAEAEPAPEFDCLATGRCGFSHCKNPPAAPAVHEEWVIKAVSPSLSAGTFVLDGGDGSIGFTSEWAKATTFASPGDATGWLSFRELRRDHYDVVRLVR